MDEIGSGPAGRTGRRVAAIAAGAALVVTAGGVAWASTGSGSSRPSSQSTTGSGSNGSTGSAGGTGTPAAPPKDRPGPGHRPGFGAGFGLGPGMVRGLEHGSFVVRRQGKDVTIDVRRGTVTTSPSSTSITVKSADGTSQPFTVTSDTLVDATRGGIADVHTGDRVVVIAVEGTGNATARRIVDETSRRKARPGAAPRSKSGSSGSGATSWSGATSGSAA